MSKTRDMTMIIEELRIAATIAINEASNWLAKQFNTSNNGALAEKPVAKKEKKP